MRTLAFLLAILLLLLTQLAKACPMNVQKISEGDKAPCSGWVVSNNQMQEFTRTDEQLELHKKLVETHKQLQKLSEAEIAFYKRRSEAQEKALSQSENKRFWLTAGAFALGVVLTGVAAKAAIESTR